MASRQDIPALTGIRGAASLWVAIYHLALPGSFITGAAAAWLGRGYLAVDLFFVLSGFVMALSYGELFRGWDDRARVPAFLLRRIARLYPLYGLILVSRFVYTALRYHSFDLPRPWIAAPLSHPLVDLPANLLLLQAWGLSSSSIGTAWSISTEWGAYFAFPILASLMLWRGRGMAITLTCLGMVLIAAVCALDAVDSHHAGLLDAWDGQSPGPMLRCLGGFILGMATWRLSRVPAIARAAGAWQARAVVFAMLGAGIVAGAPDPVLYPLFPALVLSLATARRGGVVDTRLAVWLGEISYALYLLHIFLLHPLDVVRAASRTVLPPAVADALSLALVFAALLAAADLCHRLIEKPGRRLVIRVGAAIAAVLARQQSPTAVRLTPNT